MATASHRLAICPFYRRDYPLKLNCEGGKLVFPDRKAAKGYIDRYCSNKCGWKECPVAQSLVDYYERQDNERVQQTPQGNSSASSRA